MTDIVERLEDMAATGIYPKEVREAFAEIRRLRAENQRLTLLVQSVVLASGGYIVESKP